MLAERASAIHAHLSHDRLDADTLGEMPSSRTAPRHMILHIVGARPNFMKAAPVLRALAALGHPQQLIHTGQHYDPAMSGVFFRDLDLPEPDRNLGVGSGTHAQQTAAMMVALEAAMVEIEPTLVVVYGDVNSTTAASLVAAKLGISVAHVEAGLRSFDNAMPEEINRRVTDVLSDLLFVTAPEGLHNLKSEGIDDARVHFVGNPMIDTLLANLDRMHPAASRTRYGIDGDYVVATIHRPSNVDDPGAALRVVAMLDELVEIIQVVLPLHPRGRRALLAAGLHESGRLRILDPLGYLEFMSLVRGARAVVTDSGGVQEETTVLGVPCLTVRRNTERPVTVTHGTNQLVEPEVVGDRVQTILSEGWSAPPEAPPLWDGHAGERIAEIIAAL